MFSSVDAGYSIVIDIEEVLTNSTQGDFHIFVADVVYSFDSLPAWFRKVYFAFHREHRLRFKFATGLATACLPKDAHSVWFSLWH